MPYIPQDRRDAFDVVVSSLASRIKSTGELNYVVTRLVCSVVPETPTYAQLSAARAVLSDAYCEFTRKVMDVYEDIKERENGSVHQLGREVGDGS